MTTGIGGLGQATGSEGLHGVSDSVGMINCVLCTCALSNTPFLYKKSYQRIISLFLRSRSGMQILISVEVLAVVSSIIPSSVISALSCPMDLCLDLKDQATKCISRIFIA